MAVVSRIARVRILQSADPGQYREWVATAAVQDTAAGQSVVVNVKMNNSAFGLPVDPANELHLRFVDENSVDILAFSDLNPNDGTGTGQNRTFWFTHNGLEGGTPRSGTVEIILRAVRTDVGTYDVESDGNPNFPPTGTETLLDRGWIRGTTTKAVHATNVAGSMTPVATLAYPDTARVGVQLGAASFANPSYTFALGPKSATATLGAGNTQATPSVGAVDDGYPAAATLYTPTVTSNNSAFTGQPSVAFSSETATDATVDPRLTCTHHFQVDDNAFGTPPGSKNVVASMLNTQTGFIATRITNARAEGVDGLTATQTITPRKPGSGLSASSTTATRGGEAGWTAFLEWTSIKPGGIWDKAVDVTAPANIAADAYLLASTSVVTLLSQNPAYRLIASGGNLYSNEGNHLIPGNSVLVGVALIDTDTWTIVTPQSDAGFKPTIVLGRFNAAGRAEFLSSDLRTWTAITANEAAYEHTLYPASALIPGADGRVWVAIIDGSHTAFWGNDDFFTLGRAYFEGTPYSGYLGTAILDPNHAHNDANDKGALVTAQTTIS